MSAARILIVEDDADHGRSLLEAIGDLGFAAELAALGIPSDPSFGNFILARFASRAEAEAADDHLKSKGVIVRRVGGYGLPDCLRITVGDEAGCRRVVDGLASFREGRA